MAQKAKRVSRTIAGKEIILETGKVAKQAAGAVIVTIGETVVFSAATMGKQRGDMDFFPLTVDYREKTSAAGKIPGGFFKREGRPSLKEVLTSRLIDRPVRPLWPDEFKDAYEVSIQAMVFSFDQENPTDVPALIASSAALQVSEMPFLGPIGAVRVGRVDGEFVFNPTAEQLEQSEMDIIVAGTREMITMVEGQANEVEEEIVTQAMFEAHKLIVEIVELQDELREIAGKPKLEIEPAQKDDSLYEEMNAALRDKCIQTMRTPGKHERTAALAEIYDAFVDEKFPEVDETDLAANIERSKNHKAANEAWGRIKHEVRRELILSGTREDGRSNTDVREISADVALLPRNHGSALFTRGETQAMVTVTLGTMRDEQIIDGLMPEVTKKFMLHYNFPAFSVGESWPNRGPKRREFGHGALAERALEPVLPSHDDFPYTLRVVSDIMESNGSSSMATVCGGTLALMDAGVPITRPVAGVAMGLVSENGKSVILTDILGGEDHDGDMDFKATGTQKGVTALQMDVKNVGITPELMSQALAQAREARLSILRDMLTSCGLEKPREELSEFAPRLIKFYIEPDKIGKLIGPGGKMVRKLQEENDCVIEVEDDGAVIVSSVGAGRAEVAAEKIKMLMTDVEVGQTMTGTVVSIRDFGCFIRLPNEQEGLCHVSELDANYVPDIKEVVKMGDELEVKVINVDKEGKVKVSRKAVLIDKGLIPADSGRSERPRRSGGDRDRRGGGRRGGRDRARRDNR